MNNKIIIMWGFIVIGLIVSIYIIGINEKNKEDYTPFKEKVRVHVDDYLTDYDLWPRDNDVEVTLEELKNYNYLDSLEYEGKTCNGSVTIYKANSKYNYEYDIECIKQIID